MCRPGLYLAGIHREQSRASPGSGHGRRSSHAPDAVASECRDGLPGPWPDRGRILVQSSGKWSVAGRKSERWEHASQGMIVHSQMTRYGVEPMSHEDTSVPRPDHHAPPRFRSPSPRSLSPSPSPPLLPPSLPFSPLPPPPSPSLPQRALHSPDCTFAGGLQAEGEAAGGEQEEGREDRRDTGVHSP